MESSEPTETREEHDAKIYAARQFLFDDESET